MKILILGSDGMLGHVVKIYFEEKGYDVVCTTRRDDKSELYFTNRIDFFQKVSLQKSKFLFHTF